MLLFVLLYIPKFIVTIAVIVLFYYGIKFFSRHIMPMLIDKGVKNMQQKMQDQQRRQQPSRPEGEVTVENRSSGNKKDAGNKGEYVDFEEVD